MPLVFQNEEAEAGGRNKQQRWVYFVQILEEVEAMHRCCCRRKTTRDPKSRCWLSHEKKMLSGFLHSEWGCIKTWWASLLLRYDGEERREKRNS
jgi:hypothetical protein